MEGGGAQPSAGCRGPQPAVIPSLRPCRGKGGGRAGAASLPCSRPPSSVAAAPCPARGHPRRRLIRRPAEYAPAGIGRGVGYGPSRRHGAVQGAGRVVVFFDPTYVPRTLLRCTRASVHRFATLRTALSAPFECGGMPSTRRSTVAGWLAAWWKIRMRRHAVDLQVAEQAGHCIPVPGLDGMLAHVPVEYSAHSALRRKGRFRGERGRGVDVLYGVVESQYCKVGVRVPAVGRNLLRRRPAPHWRRGGGAAGRGSRAAGDSPDPAAPPGFSSPAPSQRNVPRARRWGQGRRGGGRGRRRRRRGGLGTARAE